MILHEMQMQSVQHNNVNSMMVVVLSNAGSTRTYRTEVTVM